MRKSLFSLGSAVFQDKHTPQTPLPSSALEKQKKWAARKTLDFHKINEINPYGTISSFEDYDYVESQPTTPRQRLRQILENTDRTEDEAWTVYESLKDLKFFRQFLKENNDEGGNENFLYICKKLNYETHPSGTVIMNQGDFSNGKVYIVLSGELLVYIQKMGYPIQPVIQPVLPQTLSPASKPASMVFEDTVAGDSSHGSKAGINGTFTTEVPEKNSGKKIMKRDSRLGISPSGSDMKNPLYDKEDEVASPTKDLLIDLFALESPKKGAFKPPELLRKNSLALTSVASDPNSQKGGDNSYLRPRKMSEAINEAGTPKMSNKPSQNAMETFENMMAAMYGTLVNKINEGSYFGEKALFSKHRRNATIVTNTNVELLTLKQEDFKSVQIEFNKAKLTTIQFLRDIFPNIETVHAPTILENLIYNCEIKTFPYKKVITHEGETGEEFFVVFEGQCEFSRTCVIDKSQNYDFPTSENKQLFGLTKTKRDSIVTSDVGRGTFIGEEILFNEKAAYEYTVKVTSERVRLICFKKSKFTFRCPKKIVEGLRNLYDSKKERNDKHFQDKLQMKTASLVSPRLARKSYNFSQVTSPISSTAAKFITPEKSANNPLPLSHSLLVQPQNSNGAANSFRYSLRMDPNTLESISLLASPTSASKQQNNNNRKHRVSELNSFRVTSPATRTEIPTSAQELHESKEQTISHRRIHTESSPMHVNPIKIPTSPTKASFQSFSNLALIKEHAGEKHVRVLSPKVAPEKDLQSSIVFPLLTLQKAEKGERPERHSHQPQQTQQSPVQERKQGPRIIQTATLSKRASVDRIEEERFWDKPKKERLIHSPLAQQRLRTWVNEGKVNPQGVEVQEKTPNPDWITFLKSKKKNVLKKKQKDSRVFNKSSVEMSWKMAETASVISFGTPNVMAITTDKLPSSHRKQVSMFNANFERNLALLRMKSERKSLKKQKLGGMLQVSAIGTPVKQTRSRSMQGNKE